MTLVPVRVGVAFNDVALAASPTWTYLTDTANLVAGYTKDVGRQFEFDKTNTGECIVTINDINGVLDPTNASGPYYGKIGPLLQAKVDLLNPVIQGYETRFRGWIRDLDYNIDPSQQVTQLQMTLVDIFEILTAIEMQPGQFGDVPPASSAGNIFFDNAQGQDRVTQVMTNAGIPSAFFVCFTLNINMQESVYAPSENVLQVVQDVADAEFPTVSNVYTDRFGRLAIHGRLAKFNPSGVAASAGTASWAFGAWTAGDHAAVAASPTTTAQLRALAFNRGLDKVVNSALCTPNGIKDADIVTQLVKDTGSIGTYGIRSWSAENLLIGATAGDVLRTPGAGTLTGNNALDECKAFAQYVVNNYATPRNRVTTLTFRSMDPLTLGASATWKLITQCDISDTIAITETSPGGGGFAASAFFIEGVHETVNPANSAYADVTLSLDISPRAYYGSSAFVTK